MKGLPIQNIPENILKYYQKLEDEYNRNLQVYQSLFYQNPEGVFSLDLDGKFTGANETIATRSECDQATLLKMSFSDFVQPDYLSRALAHFEEAKKGKIERFELKTITAKGNVLDISVKSMPIYVDNAIVGIYCIVTNITNKLKKDKEIKEAIENLEKANIEKNNILESITEGFFAIDSNWKFLYCNKVVERILRMEHKKIIGQYFWDLIDMGNAPMLLEEFRKALAQKTRVNFEMYYKPFNMWLEVTAYPTDNGLSSIIKVINEEKRIEQLFTLEKEALELNASIDNTADTAIEYLIEGLQKIHPDMICSLLHVKNGLLHNWHAPDIPADYLQLIEGTPIGINQGSCGTSAYLKERVIVDDIENNILWDKYKNLALRFGFKACWSIPLLDKGKSAFATFSTYFKTTRIPTGPEMNSFERIGDLLTTIIINKKAEQEILLSKERYDIVAKATNDAIWDCDLKTRSVIWNNGISSIFGYNPSEVAYTTEWALRHIHIEDRRRVIDKITFQLQQKENTFSDEFRCLCADGSYKYVQNKAFVMNDPKTGKAIRIIGALQDVTIQKQTELKLLELNEALKLRADQLAVSNTELERFAYVASHDLQEPLRTITSFLQLFKKKYAGKIDETADNYITFAVEGADRMKQLIMDMLEYSRVNTQLKLNEEVDMHQVVREVLFNFSGKIKLSGAVIDVADNLPIIHAVKTQMMQIFQNLISNAIKYQKVAVPPHIVIDAIEKEQEWEFSVKDDGIGIDPKFFDKIFVIFQRLHSKTQYAGTGIGLAICKKIVEKHRGRLWVTSIPQEGSTFYFTIPKK
ncbi:PAS domain S-box protein [Parasediminibacterium sp. JCM 36343]|uniref:PAS domain S-box protein n=1 Tax=Parasediminibacterium sp. JCM 36343 TaxID=3374279 RepID=UPI00397BF689